MSHNYQTSFASKGNLQILWKKSYGKNDFVNMVIKTWNDIQKEMKGVLLNTFSLLKLKSFLIELFLSVKLKSFLAALFLSVKLKSFLIELYLNIFKTC